MDGIRMLAIKKFPNKQGRLLQNSTRLSFALIMGFVFLFLISPDMIFAHDSTTVERFGSFIGGLAHPILGLDHLLAMLSVGIVSAQIGGRAVWTIPTTFVVVMALGGLLGLMGVGFIAVEVGIALSVLALGLVILAKQSIPVYVVMVAVGLFAVFHGYAHGAEMPDIAQPIRYALGFLTATAIIHIAGVLIGDIPGHYKYGPIVLRVLGGVIAVFGALFLVGVL